jgi:hypothetical protein
LLCDTVLSALVIQCPIKLEDDHELGMLNRFQRGTVGFFGYHSLNRPMKITKNKYEISGFHGGENVDCGFLYCNAI